MDNSSALQRRSNYVIGEQDELSPQHYLNESCVSAEITNNEIRLITTDKSLNGIHLNIFPPTENSSENANSSAAEREQCSDGNSERQRSLSLDIHEKLFVKSRARSYAGDRRLSNAANFTFVSFQRSDSLLHITIGKSSKITKRRKRISWLFARLLSFSRRRERSNHHHHRNQKFLHESHASVSIQQRLYGIDGSSNSNDGRLKFTNDEMTVAISLRDESNKSSFEVEEENSKTQSDARKLLESLTVGREDVDIENGANELDLYMNEVRRREMRRQI